ncbi:MAG: clostripain-related cysteine peptidase, partial [Elusimicrobiaceae bacterium]
EKCDMGDYKNVIDFAGWAAYNFPAKRYMLVIANHGYGWIDPSFGEKKTSRGISFDDLSGNYIRTAQMGPMLYGVDKAIGKKLDIFYSAACLMQMVEVAYEIRNYADVLVASEASAYTSSVGEILWPNVVKAILDSPTLSTDNLAKAVVDYYAYGLKTKNLSGTLSAVRGMYIENLAKEMSAWATLAMEVNDQPAAKAAKMQAIRYDVDSYADLGDFLKIYTENMKATGPKADALRKLTAQALDHLQKFVVVRNAALGECQRSAGIAISLPARYSDALSWLPAFNALGFGKASEWGKFCVYLNQIK